MLNFVGQTSIMETAHILSQCNVLLSNDSSLAHLSEAVDTPTAVLFGPTIESFGFAPRMEISQAFSANLGCRPCSKHGKVACRYQDKACFTSINTASVATHLSHFLA